MNDPLSWVIIILCVIGHFFFSISETALALTNRFKMQVEADEGKRLSALVVKVVDKYDRALTTVLVGNNIVAIALSTVSTLLFYNYFKDTGLSDFSSLISSIIMTIIVYIFGDTLPKTIAKAIPDTISKIVVIPVAILMVIFYPIAIIFELLVKLFEVIFKRKEEDNFTSEDLEEVLKQSEHDGTFEEEQVEIIQSALEFADTKVVDIKNKLTKRNKIFAIDIENLDNEKLNDIIITTNYSRIPIYENNLDNYLGVLHVKTYIKHYLEDPNVNIRDILQEAYLVKNKVKLVDLLSGYKEHHTHLAMIEKEGHIIGMITMEDVLQELVDDISEPNSLKERLV